MPNIESFQPCPPAAAPLRFEWSEDLPYVAECHPASLRHTCGFTQQLVARHFKGLRERGYERIYMPNMSKPVFKKMKIRRPEILRRYRPSWGIPVHTNPDEPVDGIIGMRSGEGLTVFAGGCLMIIITVNVTDYVFPDRRLIAVLHGHRDLLLSRPEVKDGKPTRYRCPNLIEAAVTILENDYSIQPGESSLQALFGIHPQDFAHDSRDMRHPKHQMNQEYNENLAPYLGKLLPETDLDKILPTYDGLQCLNTSELVSAQAKQTGFFRDVTIGEMLPAGGERGFVNSGLCDQRSMMRNEVVILCPPID